MSLSSDRISAHVNSSQVANQESLRRFFTLSTRICCRCHDATSGRCV